MVQMWRKLFLKGGTFFNHKMYRANFLHADKYGIDLLAHRKLGMIRLHFQLATENIIFQANGFFANTAMARLRQISGCFAFAQLRWSGANRLLIGR